MMRVKKYGINIKQSISVDEMDTGFQGWHKNKQRVNYKKVGDGFLVDDMCAFGSKGLTQAKKVLNYFWRVTPD